MNIIVYEEKRNLIKKIVKQNLSLSIMEIILLNKIKQLNQVKIDVIDLKNLLQNKNMPISAQLNNLISLGFFKKQRDNDDERRIYLYDIDLQEIGRALEQYEQIVKDVALAE
ncbi:transcriptional regulator, SarA/Rot family [Staphylococcus auricularis]|uniref:transcriptional regulator, SarA/Rot family n=1 Tax=Staphylococcus auricularis TaxID=29379 RepID=UPI000D198FA4|nr:MarR family transcriptional regulator [Staphylococcus auricularis]PTH25734.1 MarR family transcriptional regulator [Staphylococcus auricularis]